MCIDIGFIPRVDFLVLNLNDVHESSRTIGPREILQGRCMPIELPIEGLFRLLDDGVHINGRLGLRNFL